MAKSIRRVDRPERHEVGWLVRIKYQHTLFRKFFSDAQYKGSGNAFASAVYWRDETEQLIGKPRSEYPVVGISRTGNTEPGIHMRLKDDALVFEATWVGSQGKLRRTTYSIGKHGESEALRLARQARQIGCAMRVARVQAVQPSLSLLEQSSDSGGNRQSITPDMITMYGSVKRMRDRLWSLHGYAEHSDTLEALSCDLDSEFLIVWETRFRSLSGVFLSNKYVLWVILAPVTGIETYEL